MNRINIGTALAALGLVCGASSAEPFTYQGQLKDAGAPANGLYDIQFRIHDASTGGSQIGLTLTSNDIEVVDGVFQTQLDFGDIFDGSDKWLRVLVRPGASVGTFTELLPRQPMNQIPEAQFAQVAETAMNAPWSVAPGIISYGDGNDRVFVNRDYAISGADYFGVHGNATSFNGMYVSGPADSWPFYGYSTNDAIDAYHYYNSVTDSWILYSNGATALTVDSDHDLIVSNDVEASNYRYNAPKTHYFSIPGDTFGGGSLSYQVSVGNGGFSTTQTGFAAFTAPIHLPDGARITGLRAYVTDTAAGDIAVSIARLTHGVDGFTLVASVSTAGLAGGTYTLEDLTISNGTINNELYHYHARLYCPSWSGTSTMLIKSVRIEYEVDEAN